MPWTVGMGDCIILTFCKTFVCVWEKVVRFLKH